MSEVKVFKCVGYMEQRSRIGGERWVSVDDFDRVTAERDALQVRLNESDGLSGSLERSMKNHRHELGLVQQRLTVADEWASELSKLLQRCIPVCRFKGSHTERALINEIEAALKPAEGGGDDA